MAFLVCILVFILAWCIFGLYSKNTNVISKSKKRLDGKVTIVTGGTLGMGLEIANDFAHRGAKVIIACPFEEEGNRAQKKLIKSTENEQVIFKLLDLSSLESVRQFAKDILENEERLDILVNNAGIGPVGDIETKDGMNFVMQVNYFGHFLLTMLLLPLLTKTGSKSDPARIVNTTSVMSYFGKINFKTWNSTGYWTPVRLYCNSKLCLHLFSRALSKRIDSNVVVNSVDPGPVGTSIYSSFLHPVFAKFVWFIFSALSRTQWEGAQTAIYVSIHKRPGNSSGNFYRNCRILKGKDYDDKLVEDLWQESCNAVKFCDYNSNTNTKD